MWTVPTFVLSLCLCHQVLALSSQPKRPGNSLSASGRREKGRDNVGTVKDDSLPVPQLPPFSQENEKQESRLADLFRSEVMREQDRSVFSAYRRARRKQNGQRPESSRDKESSPIFEPRSFFFEASDEPSYSLFRSANTTVFQRAAYQFFLKLLCPQQTKDAEKLRFNAAKFVADIDNNHNFVVETEEGSLHTDKAVLRLPVWLSEATSRYRQSLEAAFAMFDLFDMDRSGYLSRLDFTHWLIDTDMDRAVSVCEELSHVIKVARLSEYYGNSILRKQGRVLWNKLYDPNFAPPPVLPPEVPPTPSSIADVTVNSTTGSDDDVNYQTESLSYNTTTIQPQVNNITTSTTTNNNSDSSNNTGYGTHNSSETPPFTAHIPEYITGLSTTDISSQLRGGETEQELTSEPRSPNDLGKTTAAASMQAEEDDLDLDVQGFFKFIG